MCLVGYKGKNTVQAVLFINSCGSEKLFKCHDYSLKCPQVFARIIQNLLELYRIIIIESLIDVHMMSLSNNERGFCYIIDNFQVLKKLSAQKMSKNPKTPQEKQLHDSSFSEKSDSCFVILFSSFHSQTRPRPIS